MCERHVWHCFLAHWALAIGQDRGQSLAHWAIAIGQGRGQSSARWALAIEQGRGQFVANVHADAHIEAHQQWALTCP